MTRFVVYGISGWLFLATIALTLAAIIIPEWISWDAMLDSLRGADELHDTYTQPDVVSMHDGIAAFRGPANPVHYSYGLHSRCDSVSQSCTPFPVYEDCQGPNRTFCSLWRTTGFLMSASVVVELAALVGFAIVLLGGKQKRESGWKVVVGILAICAAAQAAAMSIVVDTHRTDSHFFAGWYLGKSVTLVTVSWCMQALLAAGIAVSAYALPEEGGYELIPDHNRSD